MADGTKQLGAISALRRIFGAAKPLSVIAAVSVLLALFTPMVTFTGVTLGISSSSALTGAYLADWTGWLCLLTFIVAAAKRFIPAAEPYLKLADLAAFAGLGAGLVWSLFFDPLTVHLAQMAELERVGASLGQFVGGMRAPGMPQMISSVSIMPHIGVLFLALAPCALLLARRAR